MTVRRFQAGDSGVFSCGLAWRIVKGRKGPGDLTLELLLYDPEQGTGVWRRPGCDLGFLMAAFLHENENVLYSAPHHRGGDMYMKYCWDAVYHGWETAWENLMQDREDKANGQGRWWRTYRKRAPAWEFMS